MYAYVSEGVQERSSFELMSVGHLWEILLRVCSMYFTELKMKCVEEMNRKGHLGIKRMFNVQYYYMVYKRRKEDKL